MRHGVNKGNNAVVPVQKHHTCLHVLVEQDLQVLSADQRHCVDCVCQEAADGPVPFSPPRLRHAGASHTQSAQVRFEAVQA